MRASASVHPFAKSFPLILSLDIFSSLRGSCHNRSHVTQRSMSSQKLREGHSTTNTQSKVQYLLTPAFPCWALLKQWEPRKCPGPQTALNAFPLLSAAPRLGPASKLSPTPLPSLSGPETALQKVDPSRRLEKVCEGPYIAGGCTIRKHNRLQGGASGPDWALPNCRAIHGLTLGSYDAGSSLWSLQELRKTLVRACLWQKIQRSQICPWHFLMWAATHQMDSMTSRWITSITLSWPHKVTLISPSTDEETKVHKRNLTGLPRWLSGEESACHCRRQVQSTVREDPTYLRAAKPGNRNYWSPHAWSRCSAKPPQWEAQARAPQLEKPLLAATREKVRTAMKTQCSQKINK